MAQRLAGSFVQENSTNKDQTRQTYSLTINIHTDTQIQPHNAQTIDVFYSE